MKEGFNHKQKIELLKAIAAGNKSINDLLPQPYYLSMDLGERMVYRKDGKEITPEQYQKETAGKSSLKITLEL